MTNTIVKMTLIIKHIINKLLIKVSLHFQIIINSFISSKVTYFKEISNIDYDN